MTSPNPINVPDAGVPEVEQQPLSPAAKPRTADTTVALEAVKQLRDLVSLYMPAWNDIRPRSFVALNEIEKTLRGRP